MAALCSLTGWEGGLLTPQSPNYTLLPLPPPPLSPPPLSLLFTENLWLEETLASLGLCPWGLPTSAPDFGGRRANSPKKSLRQWEPPACCPTSHCKCTAVGPRCLVAISSLGGRLNGPGTATRTAGWAPGVPFGWLFRHPQPGPPCLPHRCLQLLILCCQTQVGGHPPDPHLAFPHLSHPTNAGVGYSLLSVDRSISWPLPRCRRLRFVGLGWHGVGDLGIDRRFHFSPVPLGSLPLPPSLHTGFPPRLNAQGQPSLRDGARQWLEEGRGDGSGEACINTCKFPRKDRFPCKTTCVHPAPHPTPTNTDILPVIVLGGISWALRMPSQGGRLLTYRAMRSSPEVCMGQDSRVCFSTAPNPKSASPQPQPPVRGSVPFCDSP